MTKISRRDFLRWSVIGGAGLVVSCVPTPTEPQVKEQSSNLALHKRVRASSSIEHDRWGVDKAVDGTRDSAVNLDDPSRSSGGWSSDCHCDSEHTEWLTIDLGRPPGRPYYIINRVDLYPRNDNANGVDLTGEGFPLNFEVHVSTRNSPHPTNDSHWETVIDDSTGWYPKPKNEAQVITFDSVEARHVKIVGKKLRENEASGDYSMVLAEVEVYEPDGKPKFHVVANRTHIQAGKQELQLKVVRLDDSGQISRDTHYTGTITIDSSDPAAVCDGQSLPLSYTFSEEDAGYHAFGCKYNTVGLHTITVSDGSVTGRSNVTKVTEDASEHNIYFGDIHAHTPFSDGQQPIEHHYQYAKYTACLDFAAITDHDSIPWNKPLVNNWETVKSFVTEQTHDDFLAILAYEWTSHALGHKNVYYFSSNAADGEVFDRRNPDYDTPYKLWDALDRQGVPALTIPHHVARVHRDGTYTDWSYHHLEYQRLVEIYSAHGSYESCEDSSQYYFPHTGVVDGCCVQDAIGARGYRMGFIASSDNHRRYIGSLADNAGPNTRGGLDWDTGLAAVHAKALTTLELYEGMYARRTYATTGERILLEFSVDGYMMGSEYSVALPHAPQIEATFGGTQEIAKLEIIKYDNETLTWKVIYTFTPDSLTGTVSHLDSNYTSSSIYYVRVTQDSGAIFDKPEMAWSSPVWVDVDG
jgi:hypothetical protein